MPMNVGKMLMLDRMAKPTNRSEYGGSNRRMIGYDRDYETENRRRYAEGDGWEGNMNYPRGNYEPESRRRRDERGRYMEGGGGWNGYNANRLNMGGYPESRRSRDSRGRYAIRDPRMMDDEYEDDEDMRAQHWYPPYGNLPQMMAPGNSYGDIYARGTIYAPNAMNKPMHGDTEDDMTRPIDEHTARKWVKKMDGGEHFKPEQIEQLRTSICPECGKWDFFVAVNAMYSDHCETAKKMGKDTPEFYAHLAKDFLMDTDAKPGKLRRYMQYIAE